MTIPTLTDQIPKFDELVILNSTIFGCDYIPKRERTPWLARVEEWAFGEFEILETNVDRDFVDGEHTFLGRINHRITWDWAILEPGCYEFSDAQNEREYIIWDGTAARRVSIDDFESALND